jgi:hypothetical protein
MKNKSILLLVVVFTAASFSFSFVSNKTEIPANHSVQTSSSNSPIGGFALGDEIEK